MGCFLGCFGSSKKDRKRGRQRSKVLPRDQKRGNYKPVQPAVSLNQAKAEQPIKPTVSLNQDKAEQSTKPIVSSNQGKAEQPLNLVSKFRDTPGEQSFNSRKKVTFDSNVKTYDHVSIPEVTDYSTESKESDEKGKEDNLGKSNQSNSHTEDGSDSITSSLGSYPPNHRYQNCRDSDDEVEELDYEESDLDDEDEEEEEEEDDYDGFNEEDDDRVDGDHHLLSESISSMESRTRMHAVRVITEEVDSPIPICGSPEREVKTIWSNQNARDRSGYVHSVLNPVENVTQWKAVKSKGKPPLKHQKENFTSHEEPIMSFSLEPSFKQSPFSSKSKLEHPKNSNQEVAVDASLSNWLVSSESTAPIKKTCTIALESAATPVKSMSQGSNSPISLEDRPILGALTVEEIKQFTVSSSPRKSPTRSPDEMPIIGTVGSYWSHTDSDRDSGSVSSYKGIPNTTSKYREDKKVNWYNTPFETRLERALNNGTA